MQLCAIICEYNPLHLGHAWQIEQAKRRFGSVVCIMSSSFVQRGEPAVLDKFTRAQCALKAGADAVFALPCLFSLQSAEGFASGAVRLAAGLGATHLCFGSELVQTQLLSRLAHLSLHEPPALKQALSAALSDGASYPAAFQKAVQQILPSFPNEAFLPNALLGVEYLKAIQRYNLQITPFALPRALPYSSSQCRSGLSSGQFTGLPAYTKDALQTHPLVDFNAMEPSLLWKIGCCRPPVRPSRSPICSLSAKPSATRFPASSGFCAARIWASRSRICSLPTAKVLLTPSCWHSTQARRRCATR